MENLIEVAKIKRDVFVPDRNDYQREYMANKRRRDAKVIRLESLLHNGQLYSLDDRNRTLQRQYTIWNREVKQYLDRLGDLSWNEVREARKQFWALKEAELDALIVEASGPQNVNPRKHR